MASWHGDAGWTREPLLTALSQTGEPRPDWVDLTGQPTDSDLCIQTPADSPDIRHETTEQMLGSHTADRAPNGTRDIHGMILSAAASMAAESPGSNAAGHRITDALENH